MDPFRIDEIVRRLLESLPPAMRSVQQDLESNFRAVLRATLGKLDLVARDEFDAQVKVLERTRAKADALEARVTELEKMLAGSGDGSAGGLSPGSSASGPGPAPSGGGPAAH